jgi:dolichyl-phosphate beta-glucosyltransferase
MTFQPRFADVSIAAHGADQAQSSGPLPQSPHSPDFTLVVPCYNEADRLDSAAFLGFLRRHPQVRLLFVNDGSRDLTLKVLRAMQQKAPHNIDVLDLPKNAGKAEAVRQGLIEAVARGARLTGYWDADLATPLEAIPDFVQITDRMHTVDVVFGSRCRMLGHRINRTLKRRIISGICATLARQALRLPIRDTQCGAKVFRTTDALRAAIATPFTAGWLFDVELFGRIARQTQDPRQAFYELPLSEWAEIAGLIAENRLGLGSDAKADAAPTPATDDAGLPENRMAA